MKKIKKYLLVLIIVFLVFSSATITVGAVSEKRVNSEYHLFTSNRRNSNSTNKRLDRMNGKIDSLTEEVEDLNKKADNFLTKNDYVKYKNEQEAKQKVSSAEKDKRDKISNAYKATNAACDGTLKIFNDLKDYNKEDFDYVDFYYDIMDTAAGIAACIPPYGPLIAGGIKVIETLDKLIRGGEEAASPTKALGEEMQGQFDLLKSQIANIELQNSLFLKQLDKDTTEIINKIEEVDDLVYAKTTYDNFLKGTNGNFSYNELKEVLYGESYLQKAYYAKLINAYNNNESPEVIARYQEYLYAYLIENKNAFYDAITIDNYNDESTSIVEVYYLLLSNDPKFSKNDARYYTLVFAYELYETALKIEELVSSCNYYFYTQISKDICTELLENPSAFTEKTKESANYNSKEVDKLGVTMQTIENNGKEASQKLNLVETSLVVALSRIFKVTNSYFVANDHVINDTTINGVELPEKSSSPIIYYAENPYESGISKGYVKKGDTVYLNKLPIGVYKMLGLSSDSFECIVYKNGEEEKKGIDDIILIDEKNAIYDITIKYKDAQIAKFSLVEGDNLNGFNGGDGSIDNPYLISSAEQFAKINNDLGSHYKLISNIDFKGMTINPLGYPNDGRSLAYEKFQGTLDGSNYSIINLGISNIYRDQSGVYSGLFAKVGENGIVANLNIIDLKGNFVNQASGTINEFYAGAVAGINYGLISNCLIKNSSMGNEEDNIFFDYFSFIENTYIYCNMGGYWPTEDEINELFSGTLVYLPIEIDHILYHIGKIRNTEFTIDDAKSILKAYKDFENKTYTESELEGLKTENIRTSMSDYKTDDVDEYINFVIKKHHATLKCTQVNNEAVAVDSYNYVGGITAINNANIENCEINGIIISADSEINCAGNPTQDNKIYVYAGGAVCNNEGLLDGIKVDNNSIICKGKSVSNIDRRITPYITVKVAGLCLNNSLYDNIYVGSNYFKILALAHTNKGYKNDKIITKTFDKWDGYSNTNNFGLVNSLKIDNLLAGIKTNDQLLDGFYYILDKNILNYNKVINCEIGDITPDLSKLVIRTDDSYYPYRTEGKTNYYVPVSIYGLNTINEDTESPVSTSCILLAKQINENGSCLARIRLNISVESDKLVGFEVNDLQTYYQAGESFDLTGSEAVATYKSGKIITINDLNSIITFKNGETKDTITNSQGEKEVVFRFANLSVNKTITVTCNCNDDDQSLYVNTNLYSLLEHIEPTCTEDGKMVYKCKKCGEEHIVVIPAKGHTHATERSNIIDSTCINYGYSGDIKCTTCGEIVEEGIILTYKAHDYECVNEDKHICTMCGKSDKHEYKIVENGYNAEGNLMYEYECAQCGHYKTITDENIYVPNKEQPRLFITNGYFIPESDHNEVVIHIQLFNNPGITTANFGVRYDNRLKLTKFEEGIIDKGGNSYDQFLGNYWPNEESPIGINFTWLFVKQKRDNLRLVTLYFEVPLDAKIGDAYSVSVVYDGGLNGFSVDKISYKFPVNDGTISVVDHLPGDVDGNKKVDLEDITEMMKHLNKCQKNDKYIENINKYCDVDLSGEFTINDARAILLNYVGATDNAETRILSPSFRLRVVTDVYNKPIVYLWVDLNDESKDSYEILLEDESLNNITRTGYTFLNWSKELGVNNEILDSNEKIKFDTSKKIQTVYAFWKKNEIVLKNYIGGVEDSKFFYDETGSFILSPMEKEVIVKFIDTSHIYDSIYESYLYNEGAWYFDDICFGDSIKWDNEIFAEVGGTLTLEYKFTPKSLDTSNIDWQKTGYHIANWLYIDPIDEDNRAIPDITKIYDYYAAYNPVNKRFELNVWAEWAATNYNINYLMNSHGHFNGLFYEAEIMFQDENKNTMAFYYPYTHTLELDGAYKRVPLDLGNINGKGDYTKLTAVLQKDDNYIYVDARDIDENRVDEVTVYLYKGDFDHPDGEMIIINFDNGPIQRFDNLLGEYSDFEEYSVLIKNNSGETIYITDFWIGDGTLGGPKLVTANIESGLPMNVNTCSLTNSVFNIPIDPITGCCDSPTDLYREFLGFYMNINGIETMIYDENCELTVAGQNYVVTSDVTLYAKWQERRIKFGIDDENSNVNYVFLLISQIKHITKKDLYYNDADLLNLEVTIYDRSDENLTGHTGLYITPQEILYAALGYRVDISPIWSSD